MVSKVIPSHTTVNHEKGVILKKKKIKAKPVVKRHVRRTFYVAPDISAWLLEKANSEERSVSSFLSMLIRKEMGKKY